MSQHEDREKVLSAFGGKKGLIDSGVPAVIFLIVFNVTDELQSALFASIAVSAVLTITRLAMRDTVQHAVSGFIGVLICAWFANRTGNASDLYIPKLLTNLGYGTVYLIANLAGWPILGLLLGPILGENLKWRNYPERKRAYMLASWLWGVPAAKMTGRFIEGLSALKSSMLTAASLTAMATSMSRSMGTLLK